MVNDKSLPSLEFRRLSPRWKVALFDFLRELEDQNEDRHFHPHPFTEDVLEGFCHYQGEDLYYVAVESDSVLAYGMLRGWDEGFLIPSLGIAVHPKVRGTGLARAFMLFLHQAARQKGADQIRLKVYPENEKAVGLYKDLGYVFDEMEGNQIVGILTLP
jgi:ribosomal protein S18 acetylase RimI-like enzyme